jgi:hypothetical protein
MDPASIIGTTSAVLSFVNFVWKAASTARNLYESATGSQEEDERLRALTTALDPGIEKLRIRLQQIDKPSDEEASTLRVAEQCKKVGNMLLVLLDKQQRASLSENDGEKSSVADRLKEKLVKVTNVTKATIVILWNKHECEELRREFDTCTIQLNAHLLLVVRYFLRLVFLVAAVSVGDMRLIGS